MQWKIFHERFRFPAFEVIPIGRLDDGSRNRGGVREAKAAKQTNRFALQNIVHDERFFEYGTR